MLKELFQLPYVYLRQHIKPPVRHEAAVGHETVEMGVKVDEIPEGLDGNHDPRHAIFFIQGLTEELLARLIGALAELPQKLSIKPELGLSILGTVKTYRR